MQQYIRIFMPLSCETKGYEYNGKTPGGRCLLESRAGIGKLVLWVQDLKPEILYRVHLIFKDSGGYRGLSLCTLTIRPNGKAELRHAFNAADIEGFGLSLDQCQAVAIIAGEGRNASAPLCGYRESPLPWRNGFTLFERNRVVETSKDISNVVETFEEFPEELPEAILTEPITSEEIPDKAPKNPETGGDISGATFPKNKTTEETEQEETPTIETAITETPIEESLLEASLTTSPPPQPSSTTHNTQSTLSPAFKTEVDTILNSHTHMHPFQKQNRHVHWVRISLNENLSLPEDIHNLVNTPFVEAAYNRYSHLILGKTADSGALRYYIGIPAAYDPEDKVTGFRQFKCSMDNEPAYGDYGYWLIFIS